VCFACFVESLCCRYGQRVAFSESDEVGGDKHLPVLREDGAQDQDMKRSHSALRRTAEVTSK